MNDINFSTNARRHEIDAIQFQRKNSQSQFHLVAGAVAVFKSVMFTMAAMKM